MIRTTLIILSLTAAFGCSSAPQPVKQDAPPAGNERSQTAISHSTDNQPPAAVKSGEKTKWTQSGTPIDTKEFDTAIASATKTLTGKPTDTAAKTALGEAYYKRAVALTDARQYASALGDYRKAYKYDPTNAEAKQWIDMIISIYDERNQEYPKEGEEPQPLPFTKGK